MVKNFFQISDIFVSILQCLVKCVTAVHKMRFLGKMTILLLKDKEITPRIHSDLMRQPFLIERINLCFW